MEVIIIILIVFLVIYIVVRFNKKSVGGSVRRSDFATNTNTYDVKVSFPYPDKVNDYVFYKFIETTSVVILKPLLPEFKRQGIILKHDFEQAILQKIQTGKFKNPHDFKTYYENSFDFIGISFLKAYENPLSAFELEVCFVKNDTIADTDTFMFRPPDNILNTKKFKKSIENLDKNIDTISSLYFNDVWNTFEIQEYFNNNLLVFWDDEMSILEKLLKLNGYSNYNIRYISIMDIAIHLDLPTSVDELLTHFKADFLKDKELSYIVANLFVDIKQQGFDTSALIQTTKNESNGVKNTQVKIQPEINNNFVAIDVETAQGKRWSICQIGLVVVEDGVIVKKVSELIQPPNNEYFYQNTKIHKINSSMTLNKPLFPDIWNKIYAIIENKKIVAHNANFDIDCLRQTLEYYNIPIPQFEYDCTFIRTGQKLIEACANFDIEIENHHDAVSDAEACAKIYLKIMNDNQVIEPLLKYKKKVKKSQSLIKHDKIQSDLLNPELFISDKNSPFYGKKVLFTGVFRQIERQIAVDIVKKIGADIVTSITKKTDFVVTGSNPGPSKMDKISKLNSEGCDIKLLDETEFLLMIKKQ